MTVRRCSYWVVWLVVSSFPTRSKSICRCNGKENKNKPNSVSSSFFAALGEKRKRRFAVFDFGHSNRQPDKKGRKLTSESGTILPHHHCTFSQIDTMPICTPTRRASRANTTISSTPTVVTRSAARARVDCSFPLSFAFPFVLFVLSANFEHSDCCWRCRHWDCFIHTCYSNWTRSARHSLPSI